VAVFDLWAVTHIQVVAVQAPADDLARFGLGTSTFVTRLVPVRIYFHVAHPLAAISTNPQQSSPQQAFCFGLLPIVFCHDFPAKSVHTRFQTQAADNLLE